MCNLCYCVQVKDGLGHVRLEAFSENQYVFGSENASISFYLTWFLIVQNLKNAGKQVLT